MPLNITITDAGRAALVNAANNGLGPVLITEIALGAGQYAPAATATALQSEIKRVSTIAGLAVADDTLHVTITDTTTDAYDVGEFGLYTNGGVLLAVYSQTGSWIVEKAAGSTLLLAVDIIVDTLDATTIAFGDVEFINPPATETVKGVAEIATQAETDAGTDDSRFVTALKLKNWIKAASSTVAGIVKLSSSLTSTSTTVAATSSAVKAANDNANSRLPASSYTTASESSAGKAEIATQAETDAGSDDSRFVTPKKLRAGFSWSFLQNGYIVFPRWMAGLMIQWGRVNIPASNGISPAVADFTLPFSFPNAPIQLSVTCYAYTASPGSNAFVGGRFLSNSVIRCQSNYTPSTVDVSIICIGY